MLCGESVTVTRDCATVTFEPASRLLLAEVSYGVRAQGALPAM